MVIYSWFYYCEKNKIKFKVIVDRTLPYNCALLIYSGKTIFLDFSDDIQFLLKPIKFDFYFKRSLISSNFKNVFPLNFQVNISYKTIKMLRSFDMNFFLDKENRIEIIRAIDFFNIGANLSHNAMDIRKIPKKIKDNNGKIIFVSRLWNPANHRDLIEKERRIIQNEFRINACEIIKKNFKNSRVGIIRDDFSEERCSKSLLINTSEISKVNYFSQLKKSDIAIADDGLKDMPGWKIGEYCLFGKAIITTPININICDFKEKNNYSKLSSRVAFEELPSKIEELLINKNYLKQAQNNLNWSNQYLHPKNYFDRIINVINFESNK